MEIVINGSATGIDADPDTTTAELLRDGLGLTGTKQACGAGACGACTVLVEGTPAVSCLLPASALRGRTVTTVEGLNGTHPVQRAFAAHDAMQCGYCTPGFVVEAAAFVDRRRAEHGDTAPDRETIAEAMAGHLCRCGAYEGIYAAIAAACSGLHDDAAEEGPWPRTEAMEKATGRARYTTDVRIEGCLEGVLVRSTAAHARVRSVDSGETPFVDLLPEDRVVRYAGQPIGAVAAPGRAKALAAAEQVSVDYEALPPVVDPEQALDGAAPVLYPDRASRRSAPNSAEGLLRPGRWHGNLRGPSSLNRRSKTALRRIAAARAANDPRLVTGVFRTQVQSHTSMEPHACLARWDERGDLHLHASTQTVELLARQAARRWGLDPARVHVTAEHVGGGFGAKGGLTGEIIAAVELARAAQAPVRVVFDRREELTDAGNRPGSRTEISLLADGAGDLSALTVDSYGEGGVSLGSSVAVWGRFIYGRAPRRLRDFDVLTNRPPGRPFRAPGGPPLAWALEQAVDEMARRLDEDPIALRRRWDGNPKRRALYDWAAALPVWRERRSAKGRTGRFRRGVGVAAGNWLHQVDPGSQVELTVEGGAVMVRTAVQDMGTGIRSVLTDVVRRELELPASRVRVLVGHSGEVHGPASIGSRTTSSLGPAAQNAARRLRSALRGRAGTRRGDVAPAELLEHAEGLRVVGRRRRDRGGYLTPFTVQDTAIGRGLSGSVHVTEVEVDTRLGTVRPTRVWAGIAAGRIYSERLARNQCEGGVVQGIGYALFEQQRVDPSTGTVLTANLEDYRIPGIGDTPETVVHFHQEGWEHVPEGGVGLGEVSIVGVAASVGCAVYDATGWRPRDLPIRPDRVLEGINR